MKTSDKTTSIRPDATLLIQQPCAACNGTGEASDGGLCVTCYGTRRVTLHVTLAELAAALAKVLPETVRVYSAAAGY